jgi:hypothetical protein
MFYKEKVIQFPQLKHPVTVFASYNEQGLSMGLKSITLDNKNYSVASKPIACEPALTETDFQLFYKDFINGASETNADLLSAVRDVQERTGPQLIEYLLDFNDFDVKEE